MCPVRGMAAQSCCSFSVCGSSLRGQHCNECDLIETISTMHHKCPHVVYTLTVTGVNGQALLYVTGMGSSLAKL